MSELSSFHLVLEPYCDYCPNFEANIGKLNVTSVGDRTQKTITTIQCEHAEKCQRVIKRLEEIKSEETKKKLEVMQEVLASGSHYGEGLCNGGNAKADCGLEESERVSASPGSQSDERK